jgi:hypothetical protein
MFSTFPSSQLEHASNITRLLEGTRFKAKDVRRIHVGTTNFTYRIFLEEPLRGGERTVILKYSAPTTAIEPRVPFSSKRQSYEAKALSSIPWNMFTYPDYPDATVQSHTPVRLPRLFLSVPEQSFSIIEDCTPRGSADVIWEQSTHSFREFLEDLPESKMKYRAASALGGMLGNFLGQLHAWGLDSKNHGIALKSFIGNSSAKNLITQELFTDFFENIKKLNCMVSSNLVAEISNHIARLEAELNSNTQSVAMGDFW